VRAEAKRAHVTKRTARIGGDFALSPWRTPCRRDPSSAARSSRRPS
jgi:hypothetical protein